MQAEKGSFELDPSKIQEFAFRYQTLLENVRMVGSDDPEARESKATAYAAIEAGPGTYDEAEELSQRAESIDHEATECFAATLARFDYLLATGHFNEAATKVPPTHPRVRILYRWLYAAAHGKYGANRGVNGALGDALRVRKSLIAKPPRKRVPLD